MESQPTIETLQKIVDMADKELKLLKLLVKKPVWTGEEHIYVTPSYSEEHGLGGRKFVTCPESCQSFRPNEEKLYSNAVWCPFCKNYFPIVNIEDIPIDERPEYKGIEG